MFSVIIPTMWKYKPFPDFLESIVNHHLVGEVVLFNNDTENTPDHPVVRHSKIVQVRPKENTGVNYPWNLGAALALNHHLCILNDDLIFDLRVFEKVEKLLDDPETGMIGLHPGLDEFGQLPFRNGMIDIVEWKDVHTFGFGCLMFTNKKNYLTIPEGLKYYYGDHWYFDMNTALLRKNYLITNMLFYTPYATTASSLSNEDLMSETELFTNSYQPRIQRTKDVYRQLLAKFIEACDAESDINEHLPTLREYALKCKHVTEFGVREGESTKAFLSTPTTFRAYDLYETEAARSLFNLAKQANKDVEYIIVDIMSVDIEDTDLLFIDTYHLYDHLTAELKKHGNKARKYIILHDTKNAQSELAPAIIEFMADNLHWQIELNKINNNGLLVLKRHE
jgi:hypothetical protein